jgi:hypothetical protein
LLSLKENLFSRSMPSEMISSDFLLSCWALFKKLFQVLLSLLLSIFWFKL